MSGSQQLLLGTGVPAVAANYIEDVFSTWLYTGNGSTQTITNGIDLAGKGGLVWVKSRDSTYWHHLADTARGVNNTIFTNDTAAQVFATNRFTSFNSNGFSLGNSGGVNSAEKYASWTFRKAPKFFDVVTYTGNGVGSQTISHNLGSVPGCIIVKRIDSTSSWPVFHRSINSGRYGYAFLNSTAAANPDPGYDWNPTSTTFLASTDLGTNASGGTYVAYLFAHNAGGFGLTGTDNVISCGFLSGAGTTVNLGYEPQWILAKRTDTTGNWYIDDNMRGWPAAPGNDNPLLANSSASEDGAYAGFANITSTGFTNNFNGDYIYIAIRRGPMKTPTTGTSVFYSQTVPQADTINSTGVPFPPDLVNTFSRDGTNRTATFDQFTYLDRLRGLGIPKNTYSANEAATLISSSTSGESGLNAEVCLRADGQNIGRGGGWNDPLYGNWIYYFMRRAPGFFDVVCFTSSSNTNQRIAHNLGVVPELIIVKDRVGTVAWYVYSGNRNQYLFLNATNSITTQTNLWGTSNPTSTDFGINAPEFVGSNGNTCVSYLFASCPGVSKVGSYTGTGALQTINCGFTGGARFVLIKRTDSTGDWFTYDSARGISSGNDPYLLMNSTAAEVTGTNYVDTTSVGFQVTAAAPAGLNANGGTYIFLAIA